MSKGKSVETKESGVFLADDNGYYAHKVAFFGMDGAITTLKYSSIIGTDQEAQNDLSGGLSNMYETDDGQRFVCNRHILNPITIRSSDYGTTTENRVLVNHGLVLSGLVGRSVNLATALPMRDYYSRGGHTNTALIEGQAENMRNPVYQAFSLDHEESPVARILSSKVYPEGVSAIYDLLLDDRGNETCGLDDLAAPIAILDFGGSTFDVAAVSPELNILQDASGTLKRGTIDIAESFAEMLLSYLRDDLGFSISKVPSWMVNMAFEEGYVRTHHKGEMKEVNVRPLIERAATPVVQEIKKFTTSKLGDLSGYQFLMLVGGGALLCRSMFTDWEDQFGLIVRDEFANAKGMLKRLAFIDFAVSPVEAGLTAETD